MDGFGYRWLGLLDHSGFRQLDRQSTPLVDGETDRLFFRRRPSPRLAQ